MTLVEESLHIAKFASSRLTYRDENTAAAFSSGRAYDLRPFVSPTTRLALLRLEIREPTRDTSLLRHRSGSLLGCSFHLRKGRFPARWLRLRPRPLALGEARAYLAMFLTPQFVRCPSLDPDDPRTCSRCEAVAAAATFMRSSVGVAIPTARVGQATNPIII